MKNRAMSICASAALNDLLEGSLQKYQASLIPCGTPEEAQRFLSEADFCLIVLDASSLQIDHVLKSVQRMRWATNAPLIIVASTEIANQLLESGADVCVPDHIKHGNLVAHAMALLRRYTLYDYYDKIQTNRKPVLRGDIFIDPSRHVVLVRDQPVKLRWREFMLLHYFMKNPQFVLTPDQICVGAWGLENSYGSDVSGPIAILRRAIEPDPRKPIYIETIHQVGYRFTAKFVETCDI